KEITRTVKDHVAGIDPGGEGALLSIGCEFEDRVTIRRKEIARSINGHFVRTNPGGERALLSFGRESKDRGADVPFHKEVTADVLRHKEVARSVNGHFVRTNPGGERALLSIRCEFEDRAADMLRHKEIARAVKSQACEHLRHMVRIVRFRYNPRGEHGLLSFGREFEDRVTIPHKEIALVVKSDVVRVVKPGGEGAPLSIGCEFEDRSGVRVRHKK